MERRARALGVGASAVKERNRVTGRAGETLRVQRRPPARKEGSSGWTPAGPPVVRVNVRSPPATARGRRLGSGQLASRHAAAPGALALPNAAARARRKR